MKELIKKIIRRILGWYIHPLYHEDERIREEMTGYQEQLGTEREKLEEQGSDGWNAGLLRSTAAAD